MHQEDLLPLNFEVWLASTTQIINVNNKAFDNEWAAQSPKALNAHIAPQSLHLVVPILKNHPRDPENTTVRCFVWFHFSTKRVCSTVDIQLEDLLQFQEPTTKQLYQAVRLLTSTLELTRLSGLH